MKSPLRGLSTATVCLLLGIASSLPTRAVTVDIFRLEFSRMRRESCLIDCSSQRITPWARSILWSCFSTGQGRAEPTTGFN